MPLLDLGYLAAFTRQDGLEVQILDLGVEERELTKKDIEGVDLVGISYLNGGQYQRNKMQYFLKI